MQIVVIDGQGGGFGRALIEALRADGVRERIVAVGMNALATAAMLKAGADAGATGENAVVVNAARAQILAGPVGIVMSGAMLGECTPAMARAAAESPAQKVLIPVVKCGAHIAGLPEKPLAQYIADAARLIASLAADGAL